MRKTTQKLLLDLVTYTLLIAGAVIMVGPFLWMVATAFKLPADQFTHTLIPNPATLDNFRNLFSFDLNFPRLFLISSRHIAADPSSANCSPAPWQPSALPWSNSAAGTCSSPSCWSP